MKDSEAWVLAIFIYQVGHSIPSSYRKEILSPKDHCAKSVPRQVFGFDAPFLDVTSNIADSVKSKMPVSFPAPQEAAMSMVNPSTGRAQMKSSHGRKVSPPINTPPPNH